MSLCILSCGIFQQELEKVLPEIKKKMRIDDIEINYLPAALHSDNNELEKGIKNGIKTFSSKKIMMLYGNICHPHLPEITENRGVFNADTKNCIELILNPERKKELDKTGNIVYFTSGWLKWWREIFHHELEYNSLNPHIIMEQCDKIIVLDTGIDDIDEEELLILYDCVQIPIEIEQINLDYFKNTIIKTLRSIL
jgi:hypothetical protein